MQFHLNGFKPGDPEILGNERESPNNSKVLPKEVDVIIVGCGPAGLTLAAQLSYYPNIKTLIVDQKEGPLRLGQADGVACRTMEMFEAFSFSEKVLKESYWVNETSFWKPNPSNEGEILRSSRIQDTEEGLSEFPHVILNQARVHDHFLDKMLKSASKLRPHYNFKLLAMDFSEKPQSESNEDSLITCTFKHEFGNDKKDIHKIKARFVVGCDGSRSKVRDILDIKMKGDTANQVWGVMDALVVTDFPDIRLKSVVHSANKGNLLIIPREGGYLVRFYIELDKLKENERLSSREIKLNNLISSAESILSPYKLNVKEVAWWSVYEIGQRIADRFDNYRELGNEKNFPNVFIVGDSCHTHSPKAGQGMNVAMADSFNLGWKIGSVLLNQCSPEILRTYSEERRHVANDLIEFDKEFSRMFSARPKGKNSKNENEIDPKEFESYFTKYGRFTAGTATKYQSSLLTGNLKYQSLAMGFKVGMRFHSAPVIRFFDAKPMQLGHTIKADGRWRLLIFSDKYSSKKINSKVHSLCKDLCEMNDSLINKFTPSKNDIDSVFDIRAIFQISHRELSPDNLPSLLVPSKGKYSLTDYEKVFCPDLREGKNIFDLREVNKELGCIVIIRPDQYISQIYPLEATNEIFSFFNAFMKFTN